MQRRTLLHLGVVGAALVSLAGAGLSLTRPGLRDGALTAAGHDVFAAVARAVLDGMLPAAGHAAALQDHLRRVDATIATFSPSMQAELGHLVTLLASPPGRLLLTGLQPDWPDASTAQVQVMLQALRVSALPLRLQTFHALRDVTNAAYFSHADTWSLMGYPGPRSV
jgi:hypothetical protein